MKKRDREVIQREREYEREKQKKFEKRREKENEREKNKTYEKDRQIENDIVRKSQVRILEMKKGRQKYIEKQKKQKKGAQCLEEHY